MTPTEVLRKAAVLIEERGWWNGTGNPRDRLCPALAINALTRTRPLLPLRATTYGLVAARLGARISVWNDAQPNGEVVIAKLREVADDLERAS